MTMEWKKYPENKPEKDRICMVINQVGWMYPALECTYYKESDVFVHYAGTKSYLLDISHYFEMPEWPKD